MDDIYSNTNNVNNDDDRTSDEMSLFVHQILLRSSSSSCSSFTACNEASLAPNFSAPPYGGRFSSNVSTLSAGGVSENENDFDCESEVLFLCFLGLLCFGYFKSLGKCQEHFFALLLFKDLILNEESSSSVVFW